MTQIKTRQRYAGAHETVRKDWDENELEQLKKLWLRGLSASEIGAEMGRTRSAILGKLHRLKKHAPHARRLAKPAPKPVRAKTRATLRKSAPGKGRAEKVQARECGTKTTLAGGPRAETGWRMNWNVKPPADAERARPKRIDPKIWTPADAPEGAKLVTLIDLERHMCAWPYDGPDGKTLFCGCKVRPGTSWCASHHAVVFGGGGE